MNNFSCGIRDEIVLAVPGYVPIRRRDVGCFENKGDIRDQTGQKREVNMTSVRFLLIDELCLSDDRVSTNTHPSLREILLAAASSCSSYI